MKTLEKIVVSALIVGLPVGGAIAGAIALREDGMIGYVTGSFFGTLGGIFVLLVSTSIISSIKEVWKK